ncbi:CoA ester lyase [Ramlibacter sp. AN1015]|uniref:HpcH/HpaI aldolase/citrate lyase family protein n=1 Tax=Ramlibacter sp. AN1015 TaxID=3133428 RepID=UPI0030BBA9DD
MDARSLLFVPATSVHLLAKAAQRGADALIVDLEDAVPMDRKAPARQMAAQAIEQLVGQAGVLVRVNSAPELVREDVQCLPLHHLQAVLLPKVESAAQVQELARLLAQRQAPGAAPVPIAALIETPLGVLRAESIATAHQSVCALGFGAEDYASEMLVEPQPQSLLWAAQAVTNCARAFRLASWGLPGSVAEISDMDGFAALVKQARAVGFSGTVCIHPRQIPVANAGFGPTPQELAWARKVLAADEEARARGLGAVTLDGRMIDRPIVERARRWLKV